MATYSSSASSDTAGSNDSDTTYPSVPNEGSSNDHSSDGTLVSSRQERLVVHNNTMTAAQLLIPGMSCAIAKQKATGPHLTPR
jgi:hypothetical protein